MTKTTSPTASKSRSVFKETPTDELFDLFANSRIKNEDGNIVSYNVEMRNELAERNLKLIPFVIERFFRKVPQLATIREDLMQEGYLGLLDAIPKFEPEMGFKFSTYSTYWIRQQIGHTLVNMTNGGAHIPTSIKVLLIKLQKEAKKKKLSFDEYLLGKEAFDLVASLPDGGASSASTRRKLENVLAASQASYTASLDGPLTFGTDFKMFGPDAEKAFVDLIPDETQESNETVPDKVTVVQAVKEAVETLLSAKEKNVLFLRYGVVEKPFGKAERKKQQS